MQIFGGVSTFLANLYCYTHGTPSLHGRFPKDGRFGNQRQSPHQPRSFLEWGKWVFICLSLVLKIVSDVGKSTVTSRKRKSDL